MEILAQRVNKQRAESDGLGWWIDYCGRLIKTYPTFTKRYVMKRLPMIEGWIWYAFAIVDDPMNKFSGVKPSGGYIKQEAEKLIKEAKDFYAKHG